MAHIRYCSVDTELTDEDDRSEKQLHVILAAVEVNGLPSTSFALLLRFSSLKDTGTTEYWMTGF